MVLDIIATIVLPNAMYVVTYIFYMIAYIGISLIQIIPHLPL